MKELERQRALYCLNALWMLWWAYQSSWQKSRAIISFRRASRILIKKFFWQCLTKAKEKFQSSVDTLQHHGACESSAQRSNRYNAINTFSISSNENVFVNNSVMDFTLWSDRVIVFQVSSSTSNAHWWFNHCYKNNVWVDIRNSQWEVS